MGHFDDCYGDFYVSQSRYALLIPPATLFPSHDTSGSVYISSQTNGSAVVSHLANDTANKTYRYIVVG